MNKSDKNNERGAIVIEATIALSVFIFAIFTILSIVNICYIQAKIGSALANATKEISQYSFMYYKFNVDEIQTNNTSKYRISAENAVSGVGNLMDAFTGASEGVETGDFEKMAEAAGKAGQGIESLSETFKDVLNDPKEFIFGMVKVAGGDAIENGKNMLGQLLARAFMQKNLISSPGDSADSFLRRYKVLNGLSGLHFDGSSLMAYGETDEIQLVVNYQISVIKFMNLIEFEFNITQCAKSAAWGNGESLKGS